MKKLFVICLGLLMTGAVMAQGTIVGSAHDFSGESWSGGQICIACHTPHNAKAGYEPLWNHEVTTTTFTLYSNANGTLDATDLGQPTGVSLLCLSCHDGTVGLEAFGTATTGTNFVTGTALLGTSLANDHPVSFTYDTALATTDGELVDPATGASGITGGTTIAADMLYGGKMECSSCHDVHNTPGFGKLLVKSNAGSALCLTCHDK